MPVDVCRTVVAPPSLSYADALGALREALAALRAEGAAVRGARSGVLRLEAPLPAGGADALRWLESLGAGVAQGQAQCARERQAKQALMPRCYFSPRASRTEPAAFACASAAGAEGAAHGAVAGAGAAALWTGAGAFGEEQVAAVAAALSDRAPRVRAIGCVRFDAGTEPADEWAPFGGYYFVLPSLELRECAGATLLAATVAWSDEERGGSGTALSGAARSLDEAVTRAEAALEAAAAAPPAAGLAAPRAGARPEGGRVAAQTPCADGWDALMEETLARIGEGGGADGSEGHSSRLSKVVLARATQYRVSAGVDPFAILAELQQRDATAYQFLLQLPNQQTFLGSSPERLYRRVGREVASEAVAATRARGATDAADAALTAELMSGRKEHEEFMIVRDDVRKVLGDICSSVEDMVGKQAIKQASVQHLYGVLQGRLREKVGDAHVLGSLHPTPAMCGHPTREAMRVIREEEPFDRGMYAGPFGWLGGAGAEFAVAIRSALVTPEAEAESSGAARVTSYAGVGIVRGADAAAEWAELDLKGSAMAAALAQTSGVCSDVMCAFSDEEGDDADSRVSIAAPSAAAALRALPSASTTWARLAVEELVRLGVSYFCVAPGSRSTALALAALEHPATTVVPIVDERSLAFHALGYGKACGRPAAVVTTSGTAVANLAPAVHEADLAMTPMVLLTADRPFELRDCGANQALRAQSDVFGSAVRWRCNVPPPDSGTPARSMLTALAQAVHRATGASGGPGAGAVHVNMEFREPLEPTPAAWDAAGAITGLRGWASSRAPLTTYVTAATSSVCGGAAASTYPALTATILPLLQGASRGLVVAGGALSATDAWAVVAFAERTGWPVLTDVTSALRVGATGGTRSALVSHHDQLLAEESLWPSLYPDVVVQLGERPLSKRLAKFLDAGASAGAVRSRLLVAPHAARLDETHRAELRVEASVTALVAAVTGSGAFSSLRGPLQSAYASMWMQLSDAVSRAVGLWLAAHEGGSGGGLTEMRVAADVLSGLPERNALFLGNSMPIRDADMFGKATPIGQREHARTGARVAASRGASGIDGVLSTAVGYAAGTGQPTTLMVGDVSFMHDINGLASLRERPGMPPVSVVVVNNGGGRIFDFLPVAQRVGDDALAQLFHTPPDSSIGDLCAGMRVRHSEARTRSELARALDDLRRRKQHGVVEVIVDGERNRELHAHLLGAARAATRAAARALGTAVRGVDRVAALTLPTPDLAVAGASLSRYAVPTARDLTTGAEGGERHGVLLQVRLECGASGLGDIAPLPGLNATGEDIDAVQAQALALCEAMGRDGLRLPSTVALLDGSLGAWTREELGMRPEQLFPSVRFGLEAALLAALADARGQPMGQLLAPALATAVPGGAAPPHVPTRRVAAVRTSALLPAVSSPEEAVTALDAALAKGYDAFKLKVGRGEGKSAARADGAAAAAAATAAARHGMLRMVRVDANQRWSTEEYAAFTEGVGDASELLEFVEEPLSWQPLISALLIEGSDIEEGEGGSALKRQDNGAECSMQLPLALDERACQTLRNAHDAVEATREVAALVASTGAAAVVLKPSAVGGMESAAAAARGAAAAGARAVFSAAFESRTGVAAIAALAQAIDAGAAADCEKKVPTAHGLGTGSFLDETPLWGTSAQPLESAVGGAGQGVHITTAAIESHLHGLPPGDDGAVRPVPLATPPAATFEMAVGAGGADCIVAHDYGEPPKAAGGASTPLVLLLHGFLGDANDWRATAVALAPEARVVAVDLPGHGAAAAPHSHAAEHRGDDLPSVEAAADAIASLVERLTADDARPVVLAGYSMGGRVAFSCAARHPSLAPGLSLVAVSSTAGVEGRPEERSIRSAADAALAARLAAVGGAEFVEWWYQGALWAPLRDAAGGTLLERLIQRRASAANGSETELARALEGMSVGLMEPCAEGVAQATLRGTRLVLLAGARDAKYVGANRRLLERVAAASANGRVPQAESVVVPGAGHALLTEAPEAVVEAVRQAALTASFATAADGVEE